MMKKLSKTLLIFLVVSLVFLAATGWLIYSQEQKMIKAAVEAVNEQINGRVTFDGVKLSLFANFPYVSVNIKNLKIFENKSDSSAPVVNIAHTYLGFSFWDILEGKIDIKAVALEEGTISFILHKDGSNNMSNALFMSQTVSDSTNQAPFSIHLRKIKIKNIDFYKLNESTGMKTDFFIASAQSKVAMVGDHLEFYVDSELDLNLMIDGDTTFIKRKHFSLHSDISYFQQDQKLIIRKTSAKIKNVDFTIEGTVDIKDEVNLDLRVFGKKSNFDLFFAFAPPEVIPYLENYTNQGEIYFEARISGKSSVGNTPLVVVDMGCSNTFFKRNQLNTSLNDLGFRFYYTNGEQRNLKTSVLSVKNFKAKPGKGFFKADLEVKNFDEPEIDLRVYSNLELKFINEFFDLPNFKDLSGNMEMELNFHDIVDIKAPEKMIEKINQAYYAKLNLTDLDIKFPIYKLNLSDINLKAEMKGSELIVSDFNAKIDSSDFKFSGIISNLPALIHHTAEPVKVQFKIKSDFFDLASISKKFNDSTLFINEVLTHFDLKASFKSSAKQLTEFKYLPIGDFEIENISASLKNYPHHLHDIRLGIHVDEKDIDKMYFHGEIDRSEINLEASLENYQLLMQNNPKGKAIFKAHQYSKNFRFKDIFSYNGENYVPKQYRNEEIKDLHTHFSAVLNYDSMLKAVEVKIEDFAAKLKVHPLKIENVKGKIYFNSQNEHLKVENLTLKIGESDLKANLEYNLGGNDISINSLNLQSNKLNLNELLDFGQLDTTKHSEKFNIFQIPFVDMKFDIRIGYMNFNRYKIKNLNTKLRTQKNHYLHFDTLFMQMAGGDISLNGYFNGSNPNLIYLNPKLKLNGVDLDQLMFKFENFGQDQLISENLHGKLKANITGKIQVYPDLVPILSNSDVSIDAMITEGRLDDFSYMTAMADFFANKNLKKIRFDTLKNHIELKKGVLTIPNMEIASSIGYIEVSGKQDLDLNMDYTIRVPLKLVTQIAVQKLFGAKREQVKDDQLDDIVQINKNRRISFINLRIEGKPDKYKISLKKIR